MKSRAALALFVAVLSVGATSCYTCIGQPARFATGTVELTQRYDLDALAATVRARGDGRVELRSNILMIHQQPAIMPKDQETSFSVRLRNDGSGPTIVELFGGGFCETRHSTIIRHARAFLRTLPLSEADRKYLERRPMQVFTKRQFFLEEMIM